VSGLFVLVAGLVLLGLLVVLPVRPAFALFTGSLLLVPDTLRLPISEQLLLLRLVPLAFLVGLLLRNRRGELPLGAFRPTAATFGLVGFAVVAWVVGVLGAESGLPPAFSRDAWLVVLEQLLVLVAATAAVRAIGSVRAAATLATTALVVAAIGIVERVTGDGYAQRIFSWVPDQRAGGIGGRLEERSGEVRPRVAARYSLAFAWQATMLLPIVAAVAVARRHSMRIATIGLVLVAIALTASRSAYLGIAVGLLGFAALSRRRGVVLATGLLLALGALVAVTTGLYDDAFQAPEASGSNAVRDERAPVVLDVASTDPLTGLGYGSLLARGLPTTDSSWLQLYAELGAVGIVALVLSLALALAAMLPALKDRTRGSPERLVAAGCAMGVALSLVGAASLDLFTGRQSTHVLWVLVAIGVVAAEEVRGGDRTDTGALGDAWRRLVRHPEVPLIGLMVGVLVLALGPRLATTELDLQVLPPGTDAVAATPDTFVGRTLGHTVCDLIETGAEDAGASASCILPFGAGSGAIRARIVSDDRITTQRASEGAYAAASERVPSTAVLAMRVEDESIPAPVRTAPLWGAAAGAVLVLLVPSRRDPRPRSPAMAASGVAR